jgi:hypothetical protein
MVVYERGEKALIKGAQTAKASVEELQSVDADLGISAEGDQAFLGSLGLPLQKLYNAVAPGQSEIRTVRRQVPNVFAVVTHGRSHLRSVC